MHIVDLITKKRDGLPLSKAEIQYLIENYTHGKISDYQMSAFLMAVYFKGMTEEEATFLALAMRDSGEVIDLSDIKGVKVDKHSTGGVGDKVTLVLAPLVAYLGAKLAKMSGRGLGHTGGTIDKLESIPGYSVELPLDKFKRQVSEIGLAVIGQSGDIAPADKKLYALRDVTATVDSIPLIASSIMSKKLASGADAIVLDVKVGSGAFMKTLDDARKLAKLMVDIGKLSGKKVTAILTSMEEPLGHKIGNGLEVYESIETLKGKGPNDLVEIVSVISGFLLAHANIVIDAKEGYEKSKQTLKEGLAFPKFKALVAAQGGDLKYLENPELLIEGANLDEVLATKNGYVESMNALNIGKAAMLLGAGRQTKEEVIDLKVGLHLNKKIGDAVKKGDVLVTLYHHDKGLEEAKSLIQNAILIGNKKKTLDLILDTIE